MLNDTRVSDAGIYRCMVNNPPETPDPGIGELELSVVGTWAPPGQLKVSVALRPPDRTDRNPFFLFFVLFFSSAVAAGVSVGRRRHRGGERHAVLLGGGGDPRPRDPLD